MQDIPPSELAWSYIRQTEQWVVSNMRRNTVRQGDVLATMAAQRADALFLSPPARNSFRSSDARIWMWEAWWQGNPYFTIEHAYRDSLLGARASDGPAYSRAISSILSTADSFPVVVVQTTEQRLADLEPIVRNARPNVKILAPHPYEMYLIATH